MSIRAVYIDKDTKAHTSEDGIDGLSKELAAELAKYKLCKIEVERHGNAKAAEAIDGAAAKWEPIDKAQKAALAKETADADAEAKAARAAAAATESSELQAEAKLHQTNANTIQKNPNLNQAQKTAATKAEEERHSKERGKIMKKRADAESAANAARDARIKALNGKQQKPPTIDVTCTEDKANCGKDTCRLYVAYMQDAGGKKEAKSKTTDITNVAQFAKEHVYFCTCGLK